jgi:hypothetical protein
VVVAATRAHKGRVGDGDEGRREQVDAHAKAALARVVGAPGRELASG